MLNKQKKCEELGNVDDKFGLFLKSVKEGNIELLKFLLEQEGSINVHTKLPLLHIAVKRGNEEMVKLLTNAGADTNYIYNKNRPPLHIALENEYFEIAKHLLEHGADANLLSNNFNIDKHHTPLCYAVLSGNEEMVKLLVKAGADVNFIFKENLTLLLIAVRKENLKIAKCLLEQGADLTTPIRGYTHLHYAVLIGNEEMVKLIVNAGADVNTYTLDNATPLYIGTIGQYFFLTEGANVNAEYLEKRTPLHIAVQKEDLAIIKLLIKKGADVNAVTSDGRTPLLLNTGLDSRLSIHILKFLLQNGASVNAKTKNNTSALHIAAERASIRMIKLLLQYGGDVNSVDKQGATPQHIATAHGYRNIVELLLKSIHADFDIKDCNGKTILNLAFDKSHSAIVEIIIKTKQERKKLQVEKIGNSNVSLYDILIKSDKRLANILGNGDIVAIIESGTWRINFPIFWDVILEQFERGKQRKQLVDRCLATVKSLPLTFDCFKKVLDYLSNEDVQALTAADQIC